MARGFASYTKTGRSIAIGRACGESWAKSSSKSSRGSKDDASVCASFMLIISLFMLLHIITKAIKQKL